MADLQELEKQLYQLKLDIDKARKAQGPETLAKPYTLNTPEGQKQLADLFGDKDELVLIHNMGESCSYCTMWADTLQSSLPYLRTRAQVVLVSPDDPNRQSEIAKERGWDFPMLQDVDKEFTTDMGFNSAHGVMPGASTFKKQPDGTVVRTGKTFFGPLDDFNPVWHFWSLLGTPEGEWHPDPETFKSK